MKTQSITFRNDFYLDDGLTSVASVEKTVSLTERSVLYVSLQV